MSYTYEEVYNATLDYFGGDKLATNVWVSKYAMRDGEDYKELTPTDMHKRLAKELARIENKHRVRGRSRYLSKYGRERQELTEESIYKRLALFKDIIPQGSIMQSLGNKNIYTSNSNCFVIPPPHDSYGGIMHTDQRLVQLMKRRGGVGFDISTLRPAGSSVTNAALTSTGAASFMERFSNSTREVAMNGRRGALMLTMDCRHPDIMKFITIKRDTTKVTGANVSVLWHDDFMEAVEENEEYTLRWPVDAPLEEAHTTKVVSAREVWNAAIESAHASAEPGCAFIDRIRDYSLGDAYPDFKIYSSNPCQPGFATVRTPSGVSTMGDIQIGDTIWSEDGWTTVVNKWHTGIKPVYKYETTFGRFIGTDSHSVVEYGNKVSARNASSIDVLSGPYNDSLELDPQAVLDGLVLGDGSVHKASNNLIILYIGNKDEDYFDSEIKELLEKDRTRAFANSEDMWVYEVNTTLHPSDLVRTYKRSVPDDYLYGSPKKTASFLRGLFSANGSVVADGRRVTLKQSSKQLIEDVQVMLSSLGIKSYYTTNRSSEVEFRNGPYTMKESYDINITQDRWRFLEIIGFIQEYKNDAIDGETSRRMNHGNVKDVEYLGDYDVYDITVDSPSHTYWTGGLNVSNCGEVFMGGPMGDSCRLLIINLFNAVENPYTPSAYVDYDKLYQSAYEAQRLMDDVVELELEAIEGILEKIELDPEPDYIKEVERTTWEGLYESGKRGRRTGLGFTALGDVLAALGLEYGSEASKEEVRRIMTAKLRGEFDSSIDMAIERGPFPDFDAEIDSTSGFNLFLRDRFPHLHDRMMNHGRRNISISTVAPTGSTSILARLSSLHGTSGGIEPIFSVSFTRRRKVNEKDEGITIDFVDEVGDAWQEYNVFHSGFEEWCKVNGYDPTETNIDASPYSATAPTIHWEDRLDIQSIVQEYTTHSISNTANLPEDVSQEVVSNLYFYGWKKGLKGVTVYRDGSRSGVLLSGKESIKKTDAPKRPSRLNAKLFNVSYYGEWVVLVGYLGKDPFEVFAIRHPHIDQDEGVIIKRGGGVYDLQLPNGNIIKDFTNNYNGENEEALTRILSLALRHGADLKYVVEQLSKSRANLTSFGKVTNRVLKKVLPEGTELNIKESCPECGNTLTHSEGCKSCSCGYVACG